MARSWFYPGAFPRFSFAPAVDAGPEEFQRTSVNVPVLPLTKKRLTARIRSDSVSAMRIRPSVVRIICWLTVPATLGVAAYFGTYALYGERGYVELLSTRSQLTAAHAQLAQLTDKRMRLEHRIQLLQSGDSDLIEELARTKLMDGAPGQVAIPRQRQ
jgi:cell division protein FtsB